MPKLYIPDIGDVLILEKDWSFELYNEYRNDSLIEFFGIVYDTDYWSEPKESKTVTLPANSVLKVDRVYIRKGQKDFSSVSFILNLPEKFKCMRFWAKLSDVNKIEYCF